MPITTIVKNAQICFTSLSWPQNKTSNLVISNYFMESEIRVNPKKHTSTWKLECTLQLTETTRISDLLRAPRMKLMLLSSKWLLLKARLEKLLSEPLQGRCSTKFRTFFTILGLEELSLYISLWCIPSQTVLIKRNHTISYESRWITS